MNFSQVDVKQMFLDASAQECVKVNDGQYRYLKHGKDGPLKTGHPRMPCVIRGQKEVHVGEGLQADRTVTWECAFCGKQGTTQVSSAFPDLKPNICADCDRKREAEQDAARRVEWFAENFPFTVYIADRGDRGVFNQVMQAVNSSHGVFITGDTGRTKTRSVCHFARHAYLTGEADVKFMPCPKAGLDYVALLGDSTHAGKVFIESMADFKGILILDDFGKGKITERVSEMWFMVVDARLTSNRKTWFTCRYPLEQLAKRFDQEYSRDIMRRIADLCELVEV